MGGVRVRVSAMKTGIESSRPRISSTSFPSGLVLHRPAPGSFLPSPLPYSHPHAWQISDSVPKTSEAA